MAWFKRKQVEATVVEVTRKAVRLGSRGRVNVVGESNYQQALHRICGGQERHGHEGLHEVALVPEPKNRYDGNAVRVDVSSEVVGYLSRDDAVGYQRHLLRLWDDGAVGVCSGAIIGGGRDRSNYGVFLRLAPPTEMFAVNSPGSLQIVPAERTVTVTGRAAHTDVLERILGGGRTAFVYAALVPAVVQSGKHAGARCLEVQVDGHRIGELSSAMTVKYGSSIGPGFGCEVTVARREKGLHAEAYLDVPG